MKHKKCIILNKCFYGNWQIKEENIAHELINFFKANNGKIYIYNNPYGQNIKEAKDYDVDYLLFTSSGAKSFYIEYCVEIAKVAHRVCWKNNKEENLKKLIESAYDEISKNNIVINNIKYGEHNIPIDDLFEKESKTVPFTFIAKKIYKAKNPIKVIFNNNQYNYQRNMGKLLSDINKDEYHQIISYINKSNLWEEYKVKKLKCSSNIKELDYIKQDKFIDLIDGFKYEECYTKILSKLFKVEPKLINIIFDINLDIESLKIYSEYNTKEGRIDILIHDKSNLIIIENKIDSNITYNKAGVSQLFRYYKWSINNPIKYCKFKKIKYFVLTPEYRYNILKNELEDNDPKGLYVLISYYTIYNYIKDFQYSSSNNIITNYLEEIKAMLFRLSLTYFKYNKLRLENRIKRLP